MNCQRDLPGPISLWRAAGVLILGLAAGCHPSRPTGTPVEVRPTVHLVNPQRRDLVLSVGQPGYIYPYEQTSLYPKVAGYIKQWSVDIGDKIKKGQILAHLYVPELEARYKEAREEVVLAQVQVQVAQRLVEVADQNISVSVAEVTQARADIKKYQAGVERWESEVQRLTRIANDRIVDQQVLTESQRQLKENIASRSAAEAALEAARARHEARKVDYQKAKVDVQAAQAQVQVKKAHEEHLAALESYTRLPAPYDGLVTVRNANTGDYVEPRYGDETAPRGAQDEYSVRGVPVYVVIRNDVVRVYVDVPEMQASYIGPGSPATVRVQARNDEEIEAKVTRISGALNPRSRTLRCEIDLPNARARLQPGMYAYAKVEIKRPHVWTLPLAAVTEIQNETCCYLDEDGKAIKTPLETGIHDDRYIEVFRKQGQKGWVELTGDEHVIMGELAELRDGQRVEVSQERGMEKGSRP